MSEPKPAPETSLVVRKLMAAPRERVFAAWLDPVGMSTWMCPGKIRKAEVEIDPRVGGKFRILMKGTERDYDHRGEYLEIASPSRLVFTWISAGTDGQETRVTVELHERAGGCELVLTHERFPRPDNIEQHRNGWGDIVVKLDRFLAQANT